MRSRPTTPLTASHELNKKQVERGTLDYSSRIQGFKSIYLQQPIHFATVLINKTYSTITRQIEITNHHYNNQNYECVIAQYNLN